MGRIQSILTKKLLSLGVALTLIMFQMPLGLLGPQTAYAEELDQNVETESQESTAEDPLSEDDPASTHEQKEAIPPSQNTSNNVEQQETSNTPATPAVSSVTQIPALNDTETLVQDEMNWEGNGSENADPECEADEASFWHWILTPGGNNNLISASLEVTYESGATTTTSGEFRDEGGGAMHFDVTRPVPDVVESAIVTFTYTGDGGNFVLTISDSSCEEGEPEDGSITIVKDAVPNHAQDFAFTSTGKNVSNFTLDDDSDSTLSNQKAFQGLSVGTYTFTETQVEGWELKSISCDEEVAVNLDERKVTIELGEGMDVSCTFTNQLPVGGGDGDGNPPSPPVGGGGRSGGIAAPASAGAVLGVSTLADTGQNLILNAFVGITAMVLSVAVSLARPKRHLKSNAASAPRLEALNSLVLRTSNKVLERLAALPVSVVTRSLTAELRRGRLA